jgi:2-oxoglutarate ferredoxin oxidoreductase subunit alpha
MGKDVSVVLCGEAGQGIQTVEYLLDRILQAAGYHVFSTPEYMSRIRGGSNSSEIRVSRQRASAFVKRIDILVPFSAQAISHLAKRISAQTFVLGERENLSEAEPTRTWEAPFSAIAAELGNPLYANTVAVGAIAALFAVEQALVSDYLRQHFSSRTSEIVEGNIQAAARGFAIGEALSSSGKLRSLLQPVSLPARSQAQDELILTGTDAVALGAIAGGCDFLSVYPMSPSTGVFTFLAQHKGEFGIVVEQAEDEIAAINMALGASYAGARTLVTTSGGGFALMEEAVSLAGAQETPVVIHLGQRPGPATGLPTRTEQGDLELALYAGHGEFPHILLAPGTIQDAFYLTQRAFDLAAKYQTPVILLTDQYLLESSYCFSFGELRLLPVEKHLVQAEEGYQRYKLTSDGISPRAVPGWGSAVVPADSHEHSEDGHITEDEELRTKMVEKRLKKLEGIIAEAIPARLVGSEDYRTLIVGWGSTYHAIAEAMAEIAARDTALLYFQQIYPLPADAASYLKRAERVILVENNATGQFGKLLKLYTGVDIPYKILKYSGAPFSVEELVARLGELLG